MDSPTNQQPRKRRHIIADSDEEEDADFAASVAPKSNIPSVPAKGRINKEPTQSADQGFSLRHLLGSNGNASSGAKQAATQGKPTAPQRRKHISDSDDDNGDDDGQGDDNSSQDSDDYQPAARKVTGKKTSRPQAQPAKGGSQKDTLQANTQAQKKQTVTQLKQHSLDWGSDGDSSRDSSQSDAESSASDSWDAFRSSGEKPKSSGNPAPKKKPDNPPRKVIDDSESDKDEDSDEEEEDDSDGDEDDDYEYAPSAKKVTRQSRSNPSKAQPQKQTTTQSKSAVRNRGSNPVPQKHSISRFLVSESSKGKNQPNQKPRNGGYKDSSDESDSPDAQSSDFSDSSVPKKKKAPQSKPQPKSISSKATPARVDPGVRAATLGLRNRGNVKYADPDSEDDDFMDDESDEASSDSGLKISNKSGQSSNARSDSSKTKGGRKEGGSKPAPKPPPKPTPKPTKKNRKTEESEDSESESSNDSKSADAQGSSEEYAIPQIALQPNSIEKIICHREVADSEKSEFFVKYKYKSYVHANWISEDEVLKEAHGKGRIIRYFKNQYRIAMTSTPDEPIPPEFLEIERVLSIRDIPEDYDIMVMQAIMMENTGKSSSLVGIPRTKSLPSVSHGMRRVYLIKWRSLQYSESTWEEEEVVTDDLKIQEYLRFNKIPSSSELATKPRPSRDRWVKQAESPKYQNGNRLRDYQLEGFNWLTFCWFQQRNTILADEMGLGKTVQSLSILNYLFEEQKIRGPFLVIAPLSTVGHWLREFERWTLINCICYYGVPQSRKLIQDYEMYYKDESGSIIQGAMKFNVLVTTFEMILSDLTMFRKISWKYAVIDEGHRLKNRESKLLEAINSLDIDHKLLLTGTPIQNNVSELWNLLNFLDPENFSSSEEFLGNFGNLTESSSVEKLQEILRPYMLRRMKEHVEKSLIPKEETIIGIDLTPIQKKYYRMVYYRNSAILKTGAKGSNGPSLMNIMMELRKLCNHPFIVNGLENEILHENGDKNPQELLITTSGKMVVLDKLLSKLFAEKHKVLIFSQMARVLDLLEDFLHYRNYIYERIDGSIRGNDRQAAIDRFCRPNSDRFVFLISTKAGGFGINLTPADTVIIFDSDWNPQNDLQAQARCHRIGQTKLVKVYRLVTNKTYESYMLRRASKKLGLDKAILSNISNQDSSLVNDQLDKEEIDKLLRFGAYQLLDDEEDSEVYKYEDDDIDDILGRSTTITNDEPSDSALSTMFSKASFEASEAPQSTEDPSFWNKVLKNSRSNPLIQYQPRQRKQVQRYGVKSDSEEAEDESDDQSSYSEDKSPGKWNRKEFIEFRKILLLFGYGRWDQIKEAMDDERTLEDIRSMADRIVVFNFNIVGERYKNQNARFIAKLYESVQSQENPLEPPSIEEEFLYLPGKPFANQPDAADEERKAIERAKNLIRRLDQLAVLNLVVPPSSAQSLSELGEDVFDLKYLRSGTALPVEWWTNNEDKHLLIGTYWHGYANFEKIMKDARLCFVHRLTDKSEDQGESQELSANEEWVKILNKHPWIKGAPIQARLKALINSVQVSEDKKEEAILFKKKQEEKQMKIVKKNQEKEEREKKKEEKTLAREEIILPLSRKEKNSVQKGISLYGILVDESGLYRLEEFQKANKLERKSLIALENYIQELIAQSHVVIELAKQKQQIKDEKEDQKEDKEESKEESSDMVSLSRATKIIQNIQTFKDLKDLVANPSIEKLIRNCRENLPLMPQWWQSNAVACDKTFLLGVQKHGFGEWAQICKSEPFSGIRTSLLMATMKTKQRPAVKIIQDDPEEMGDETQKSGTEEPFDFPGFPSDRDLMKRLDSLIKHSRLAQNPEPVTTAPKKDEKKDEKKSSIPVSKGKQTSMDTFIERKRELPSSTQSEGSDSDFQSPEIKTKRLKPEAHSPDDSPKASDDTEAAEKAKMNTKKPNSIERDSEGKPVLPITTGTLTLHCLGEIEYKREAYHTERYIYPIGYRCSKNYYSVYDPSLRENYLCEILDGGEKPKFKISWNDGIEERIGDNPTGVWTDIVKKSNKLRSIDRKGTPSVSGPEYFGLANTTIQNLIQEMPESHLCRKFKGYANVSAEMKSSASGKSNLLTGSPPPELTEKTGNPLKKTAGEGSKSPVTRSPASRTASIQNKTPTKAASSALDKKKASSSSGAHTPSPHSHSTRSIAAYMKQKPSDKMKDESSESELGKESLTDAIAIPARKTSATPKADASSTRRESSLRERDGNEEADELDETMADDAERGDQKKTMAKVDTPPNRTQRNSASPEEKSRSADAMTNKDNHPNPSTTSSPHKPSGNQTSHETKGQSQMSSGKQKAVQSWRHRPGFGDDDEDLFSVPKSRSNNSGNSNSNGATSSTSPGQKSNASGSKKSGAR